MEKRRGVLTMVLSAMLVVGGVAAANPAAAATSRDGNQNCPTSARVRVIGTRANSGNLSARAGRVMDDVVGTRATATNNVNGTASWYVTSFGEANVTASPSCV